MIDSCVICDKDKSEIFYGFVNVRSTSEYLVEYMLNVRLKVGPTNPLDLTMLAFSSVKSDSLGWLSPDRAVSGSFGTRGSATQKIGA